MHDRRLVVAVAMLGILAAICPAVEPAPKAKPAGPKPVKPKASKPVVKDGLSISVQPSKIVYARREPIVLAVTLRNVSKKTFALSGSNMLGWIPGGGLTFTVKDVKTGKVRTLRSGTNPMIMAPVRLESKTLAPGGSVVVRVAVNRWSWYRANVPVVRKKTDPVAPAPRQVRRQLGAEILPGGLYRITVSCKLGKGFRGPRWRGGNVPFWTGEIASKPVEVRVDPNKVAPAPGGGRPGGAKWTKLFADEPWYKRRKGAETSIMGTLQAVPNAGGMSTLQRTCHYRIGKYRLYTAARKHPDLDKLVGKPVQIRGKIVEMNLEGQHLREVWPAAIRPGVMRVGRPVVPGVSRPIRGIKPRPLAPAPAPRRRPVIRD